MAAKDVNILASAVISLISFFTVFTSVASQHMIVTHSPDYLIFSKTGERIPLSEVSNLVASTLGFTPSRPMTWTSLSQGSFFHRPKANVILSVDGFESKYIELDVYHVARYPTADDAPEVKTDLISEQLRSLPFKTSPLVIDLSVENIFDVIGRHPDTFANIASSMDQVRHLIDSGVSRLTRLGLGSLNVSDNTEAHLLSELQLVLDLIAALEKDGKFVTDNSPDLLHFRVTGFGKIVDAYGPTSAKANDALKLIKNFITEVTSDLKRIYSDNVVVEVFTVTGVVNPKHVRKVRSLLAAQEGVQASSVEKDMNLAKPYDPNYSAMFNIILWTMVILAVVVFSVSAAIWNMDPGRDSIIYRMTSQRIKKD